MNLHCNKLGNPHGRPIIFLHGLFGSSADFSFVSSELKERSQHLWDLPGHGKSDPLWFSSFGDFATYFFNQLGGFEQTRDLVGYALGWRIALLLISNYPESFNRAIIISANPGIALERERLERLNRDRILLDDLKSPEFFLRDWYAASLFGNLALHPKF